MKGPAEWVRYREALSERNGERIPLSSFSITLSYYKSGRYLSLKSMGRAKVQEMGRPSLRPGFHLTVMALAARRASASRSGFTLLTTLKSERVPALMVVLLIIICGFLPALNLVSEKESGTIEAINVSPVGRMTFVLSKLIPYWIAGLLVLTIAMLIGGLVYGVWPAGSVGAVILAAMLFIIVMSALGIVIASKSATMLQSILVMFAIIMIFQLMGGLFTPISSMPGWAQAITYAVPPRYFIEIVRDIYLKGSTVADLAVPYLTLTAIAAALSLLAALTYKKQA